MARKSLAVFALILLITGCSDSGDSDSGGTNQNPLSTSSSVYSSQANTTASSTSSAPTASSSDVLESSSSSAQSLSMSSMSSASNTSAISSTSHSSDLSSSQASQPQIPPALPSLSFLLPLSETGDWASTTLPVEVKLVGIEPSSIDSVRLYLDGNLIRKEVESPYLWPDDIQELQSGKHILAAEALGHNGERITAEIEFSVSNSQNSSSSNNVTSANSSSLSSQSSVQSLSSSEPATISSSSSFSSSSTSMTSSSSSAPTPSTGEDLYFTRLGASGTCASCHGDEGEGVSGRGPDLINCNNCSTFTALEAKIANSMPVGNSSDCDGLCATKIAEFIWQDFNGNSLVDVFNCDAEIQKASSMRRLNKSEIINSINDVFGTGGAELGAHLPAEFEVIGGFATVGSALTTSTDWTDALLEGAISAAEEIVSSGRFKGDCSYSGEEPPGIIVPAGDQCDNTPQCRAIFGSAVTNCVNDAAEDSVCMCGDDLCTDVVNTSTGSSDQCFTSDIQTVGRLLFRSELSESELNRAVATKAEIAQQTGSEADGTIASLVTLLTSPKFLFSIPDGDKSAARDLSESELADRLALTLWGAIPDNALLTAAEQGELKNNLDAYIELMIADNRFDRFVEVFAEPWLGLGNYYHSPVNFGLTDQQWQQLLHDMKTETRLFISHIILNNLPINELYTANYTFMNKRLADLYEIPYEFEDNQFRKTTLPPSSHRRGLMTHASVLAKAYDGNKTSVVKRGVLPLEAFTCTAPEAPSDDETAAQVNELAAAEISEKEKMAVRANNPSCAGCHAEIDPIGWVFTEFGPLGEPVAKDPDGDTLSTSGLLYGHPFDSAHDFVDIINQQGHFESCFASKFLIHAIGRQVSYHKSTEDACAIDQAIKTAEIEGKIGARDFIKSLLTNEIATFSGTILD